MMVNSSQKQLRCSFCDKTQKDVRKLIANKIEDSYICDECVNVCTELLIDSPKPKAKPPKPINSPRVIKNFLDQYVIGQDHAKEVLAVAVYNHYKRLEHPTIDDIEIEKSNILMIGPTGAGKTLLAQSIARILDVPLAIADTTSLTEAGYVGDDVESVVGRLLQTADYDVKRAERGIIFLDEIDKKRARESNGMATRDIAGEGVQQALLKLLEGTEIFIPTNGRKGMHGELVRVNTRNILFILGGAFVGLDKMLDQDDQLGIGFKALIERSKTVRQVQPEHLIKFGLIPELIGRVPVITILEELDEMQLMQILTQPKNALVKQYEKMFKLDGIDLQFDQEALQAVAKMARARKTNGRALRGVLESSLLRTQFNLPDLRDQGVERVIVSAATITNGVEPQVIYKVNKRSR